VQIKRSIELFNKLQPITAIQERVDAFVTEHYRPQMIGVHLRRGDVYAANPTVSQGTQPAIAAVEGYLAQYPEAGIFLSTDDGAAIPDRGVAPQEGIKAIFRERFGERVLFNEPRSLDRNDLIAVQDAVVDLWLLRRTTAIVGTQYSSFSTLASFGRTVPVIQINYKVEKAQ
jgi:hypothetical protein